MSTTHWTIIVVALVLLVGWMGSNYVLSPSQESADRADLAMVRHYNPLTDSAVTNAAARDKGVVEATRAQMARDLESKQEATRQAAIDELTKTATEPLKARIVELEAALATRDREICELKRTADSLMMRLPIQWAPVAAPAPLPAPAPVVAPAPLPAPAPVAAPAPLPAPAPVVAPVVAPTPTVASTSPAAVTPVTPAPTPAPPAAVTPVTPAPCPDVTR